jgi:hypothetical protein
MNTTTNGTHHVARQPIAEGALATCPTCASRISQKQYDKILRISEARTSQLAHERATVERERDDIARERANIASAAVAAERAKWEADAERADREAESLRKRADTERERLARAHEQAIQAEIRKREGKERELARERAAAQAKADALVRDAKRALEERQARVVDGLHERLKTLEQRRRRDEDTLRLTIAKLQEKADVRDQAHFGPEGEAELVKVLREQFPGDKIEHRGMRGDVLQTVLDGGQMAGTIVFECKRTRAWQLAYVRQTKTAMEANGTRYGVLVSRHLPPGRTGMCVVRGVIVVVPAIAAQVVAVLREGVVTIARLRLSQEGTSAKSEALLEYLRGQDFSNAIQLVQEKVGELRDSLTRERSHHDGWWRTREQHYAAILREASGIDARICDLLGGRGSVRRRADVGRQ